MARRRLDEREVRKISKRGVSYSVTLPIDIMRELGWKTKQKVIVRKSGKKIIIEDWKRW